MKHVKRPILIITILVFSGIMAFAQQFGDPNSFFKFGKWTCGKTSDDTFSAWFEDGSTVAVNIVRNSNGYWYLKSGGKEKIVWSQGTTAPRAFSDQPWKTVSAKKKLPALPSGASISLPYGKDKVTSITNFSHYIEIVLTDDGIVTIFGDRSTVYYTSRNGRDIQFAPDGEEEGNESVGKGESKDTDATPERKLGKDRPVEKEGLVGKKVKIANIGAVYSTINRTDCLAWPDEKTKRLGGSDGWNGWRPRKGDEGTVVAVTAHCSTDLPIAIVQVGDKFVAIELEGLVYAN